MLEAFIQLINPDGLMEAPHSWNFTDWVPSWHKNRGVPPDGHFGISGVLNWQLALVLGLAAELETFMGEPELACRNTRLGGTVRQAAMRAFWDEKADCWPTT